MVSRALEPRNASGGREAPDLGKWADLVQKTRIERRSTLRDGATGSHKYCDRHRDSGFQEFGTDIPSFEA